MAEIEGFIMRFTVNEIRAIQGALGQMSSAKYDTTELAHAGADVYNRLVPFADKENWDE